MKTTTQAIKADKDEFKKIDLSCLEIKITRLQLPDLITRETIVRSKLKGAASRKNSKSIPFSGQLVITKPFSSEMLKKLGLKHSPKSEVLVCLSLSQEKPVPILKMNIRSQYQGQETGTRTERYNERYISGGQHTPYGPKNSPGYWDYETREVSYTYPVDKTEEIKNAPVSQAAFNELYLSILNSAKCKQKSVLIDFLHDNFTNLSEAAQSWISARLREKVEIIKAKLQKQTGLLESLSLPKLKRHRK